MEPSAYANASLGEIINIIGEWTVQSNTVQPPSKEVTPKTDAKALVFQLVSEKTGFPKEALKNEFRLLDDLNLDSIKAGSLMAQLAKQFQIQDKLEPSAYANASLEEIINKINSSISPQSEIPVSPKPSTKESSLNSDWVHSFSVELIEEQIEELAQLKVQSLGLIYTNNNEKLVLQFVKSFAKWSERVEAINHKELSNWENSNFEKLIVIIPETAHSIAVVAETVEMLSNVAKYTANKTTDLAFVQFGNGLFSRGQTNTHLGSSMISAVAFASSLHLERPLIKIRALEFDPRLASSNWIGKLFNEFISSDSFKAIGFDAKGVRRKMAYELAEIKAKSRTTEKLNSDDVVLITGGAKGITAECALALGEKYGCKLALVGSSVLSPEIEATLQRFKLKNITAEYFSCNISSAPAIKELISNIENHLGKISAVVHGAGINKPRRAEQVTSEEALNEISPKLRGAYNLAEVLRKNKLKYFVAFTSIIGVTGMQGNSWYAFSNETLDLFLRNYKKQTGTETLTIAYSVWSEVGMGERMGSTKTLSGMGISAIAPDKGIAQFLHWIEHETDDQQIVVAAKLGGLDTWKRKTYSIPVSNRYLEDLVYYEPGVELVAQATLSRYHDRYTDDHSFNGSLLFPTVFGIEAMAQAALCVTGKTNFTSIIFENISLQKPIVVPQSGEAKIQVRAEVVFQDGLMKVITGVSTEDSNFNTNHFSAEITFSEETKPLNKLSLALPEKPLTIEPKTDLYSWLLFQGKTFQNIDKVYSLNSQSVCFSVKSSTTDTSELCFSSEKLKSFILGSPLLRDVLLQTAQLILTKNIYLPIGIKRWEIYQTNNYSEKNFVECNLQEKESNRGLLNVSLVNQNHEILESISGYEVKALKPTPNYPTSEEIANEAVLENAIKQKYSEYSDIHQNKADLIVSKNALLFNMLDQTSRHSIEQQIFTTKYLPTNTLGLNNTNTITWLDNGKPEIAGSTKKISISHSRSFLIMTIGSTAQGCDIEFVEPRAEDEWVSLLGENNAKLISEIKGLSENYNISATRFWCVRESILKAYSTLPKTISVENVHKDGVVFKGEVNNTDFRVLTFPVQLWPNNISVIALLLSSSSKDNNDETDFTSSIEEDKYKPTIKETGHSNEPFYFDKESKKFVHNFSTTFKDCKAFFGKTYFTDFPLWMGHLRELVLTPISQQLLEDFRAGEYGMVTNTSSINVFHEAESLNNIIGKIGITKKSNFAESFIDLNFEWFKKDGNGKLLRLANSNLSTTWVKIEGHGIVKRSPIPNYFLDFLNEHLQSQDPSNELQFIQPYVSSSDLGSLKYQSSAKPRPELLLSRKIYQTGIHNGNSVGNLYYSNYYDWQAKTLEQLLYLITPQLFTEQGRAGEYICLESKVNHLQEAMPFEEIEVAMYLEELYEKGFKLYFEYFSKTGNRKLAYGHNLIAWASRKDEKSLPNASPLPANVVNSFMEFAKNNAGKSLEDSSILIRH